MTDQKTPNDPESGATKIVLAVERARREKDATASAKPFREHLLPPSGETVFHRMPQALSAEILHGWGLIGRKRAEMSPVIRLCSTARGALEIGDLDDETFLRGITPELVAAWADLPAYWRFLRDTADTGVLTDAMLDAAMEMGMLFAKDVFDALTMEGASGVEVVADFLEKAALVEWIAAIATSGDATPKGMLDALGGMERLRAAIPNETLAALVVKLEHELGLAPPETPAASEPAARTDAGAAADDGGEGDRPSVVTVEDDEIVVGDDQPDIEVGGTVPPPGTADADRGEEDGSKDSELVVSMGPSGIDWGGHPPRSASVPDDAGRTIGSGSRSAPRPPPEPEPEAEPDGDDRPTHFLPMKK